jgi:hypothetical protein
MLRKRVSCRQALLAKRSTTTVLCRVWANPIILVRKEPKFSGLNSFCAAKTRAFPLVLR